MMKMFILPIHKEGLVFATLFGLVSVLLWHLTPFLGGIGFLLTAWCLYFFRNPDRVTPLRNGLIISPADGMVQMIASVIPPKEAGLGTKKHMRVSIFMNVFNVHINRIPVDGVIEKIHYYKGRFFNASLDKASEFNERQLMVVTTKDDHKIAFVQIAGLIARRIRCDVTENQEVKAGERFGLIRFGSRVDVYLPDSLVPLVCVGQKMVAGETVLADMLSKEKERIGEIR
ncbi:MAG: phosphatidylserine decarboxylase [Alphaproteobacteria bacterium]